MMTAATAADRMKGHRKSTHEMTGSLAYLSLACLVAALGGLLFGFDTAVISGAEGMLKAQFHLSQVMHGWIVSSALVGCLLGSAIAGTLSDRFGRKKVLLLAAVLFTLCAVGSADATVAVAPCRCPVGRRHGHRHRLDALADVHCGDFTVTAPRRLDFDLPACDHRRHSHGLSFEFRLARLAAAHPEFYGVGVWQWMFVERGVAGDVVGRRVAGGDLVRAVVLCARKPAMADPARPFADRH